MLHKDFNIDCDLIAVLATVAIALLAIGCIVSYYFGMTTFGSTDF
jgi:phage shock protein PspC (stress-responsive transcriptional regulator)